MNMKYPAANRSRADGPPLTGAKSRIDIAVSRVKNVTELVDNATSSYEENIDATEMTDPSRAPALRMRS